MLELRLHPGDPVLQEATGVNRPGFPRDLADTPVLRSRHIEPSQP